jgi:hypothetical protein
MLSYKRVKQRRASTSGVTLLEVLVVSLIGVVLLLAVAELFTYQIQIKRRAAPKGLLSELVSRNMVELSTRSVANLPGIGNCWVRSYRLDGSLIASNTVASNHATCTDPVPPTSSEYRVVLRFLNPLVVPGVEINFSPPEFLKLPPGAANAIMMVEVVGAFRGDPQRGESPIRIAATTFKR